MVKQKRAQESFLEWKFFFKNMNSIGKPLKGYKLKIFNRGKEIKRPNKNGELVLFGKMYALVMRIILVI